MFANTSAIVVTFNIWLLGGILCAAFIVTTITYLFLNKLFAKRRWLIFLMWFIYSAAAALYINYEYHHFPIGLEWISIS